MVSTPSRTKASSRISAPVRSGAWSRVMQLLSVEHPQNVLRHVPPKAVAAEFGGRRHGRLQRVPEHLRPIDTVAPLLQLAVQLAGDVDRVPDHLASSSSLPTNKKPPVRRDERPLPWYHPTCGHSQPHSSGVPVAQGLSRRSPLLPASHHPGSL